MILKARLLCNDCPWTDLIRYDDTEPLPECSRCGGSMSEYEDKLKTPCWETDEDGNFTVINGAPAQTNHNTFFVAEGLPRMTKSQLEQYVQTTFAGEVPEGFSLKIETDGASAKRHADEVRHNAFERDKKNGITPDVKKAFQKEQKAMAASASAHAKRKGKDPVRAAAEGGAAMGRLRDAAKGKSGSKVAGVQ